MNAKELSQKLTGALQRYRSILILIKGSPDPDAIASSFALKTICDHLGVGSEIVALAELSLAQNRSMVEKLHIPVRIERPPLHGGGYDGYAVVDHQSASARDLQIELPCVLHIDHHEKLGTDIPADFRLILKEAGSVSTIMALILRELSMPLPEALLAQLATALHIGIQVDTDNYRHAGRLDEEALQYLSEHSDKTIIRNITNFPYSEVFITLIARAMINRVVYRDWLIAGIGFIDESQRDNIALVADSLLEQENVSTVVVFAIIEKNNGRSLMLDASFRTRSGNLNLNDLIKEISSEGGARRYKGAYQVNLDYFAGVPDKKKLWDMVNTATLEIIKKKRDTLPIIGLRSLYRRFKTGFLNIFSKQE